MLCPNEVDNRELRLAVVRDVDDDIRFTEESESPSSEKMAKVGSKFLHVSGGVPD